MNAKVTMPSRTLIDRTNPAPYTNSASTDIRQTFARIAAEMAARPAKPRRRTKAKTP